MKVTTTKIIIERENDRKITIRTFANKQTNIKYTSKDGICRIDSIFQNDAPVYPLIDDGKGIELFNSIADQVDTNWNEPI